MSKLIKKVTMGSDEMYYACGPCGGQDLIEMVIDHDGKEIYISASSIGEDVLYYVSDHSVYGLMEDLDENINDEVIEWHECGSVNNYENEDEVAQSEYYDCFKYLTMILNESFEEGEEYSEDYGKDIEEMTDLISFSGYDFCFEDNMNFESSTEDEIYKKRLFLEANIMTETVYDSIDSGVKKAMIKDLTKLDKAINLDEYESWKEKFLESEYEKVKNKRWVTVGYLFAGIGQYKVTFPKNELPCFTAWIRSNGSAFMSKPEKATEKEIKMAIALNLFD